MKMDILLIGDLHLRTTRPRCRTEVPFADVGMGKLHQALQIAHTRRVDVIVQVGDWFHSPNPSGELIANCIRLLCKYSMPQILAIHGQHDLEYHTEAAANRSALRVMEAAGCLTLLDPGRPYTMMHNPAVTFVGAPFGAIPESPAKAGLNVLVAHAMVGDKALWPGQDLTGPEAYMRRHPGYNLYLLGDYHYPWQSGRAVNAGCVIRQQASERELAHEPKVVLITLNVGEEPSYEDIPLRVAPAAEAFDLTQKSEADEAGQDIMQYVAALKDANVVGVDFQKNLQTYLDENEEPKKVRDEIWQALELK